MEWIEKRQVSQRNLSWDQKHLIMGRAYERTKRQGERTDLTFRQNGEKLTAEILAGLMRGQRRRLVNRLVLY